MLTIIKEVEEASKLIFLNNYTIINILGSGCHGKVYLVEHKITGYQYAMKEIEAEILIDDDGNPEYENEESYKKQVEREINGLKMFSKYNIGPIVYEYCILYPKSYIVMEKCDKTLECYLKENKNYDKIKVEELIQNMINIKEKYKLHHGDIKSHNVMLNLFNNNEIKGIKLIDFSFSRLLSENDA